MLNEKSKQRSPLVIWVPVGKNYVLNRQKLWMKIAQEAQFSFNCLIPQLLEREWLERFTRFLQSKCLLKDDGKNGEITIEPDPLDDLIPKIRK
jgi:hypothetical protein